MERIPVKKNQIYTVDITGLTHEGIGVGRIEGFVVFVGDALPGETAETRIIKVNKGFAVGRLNRIIKGSASRTEPFCTAFYRCGGCTLQHLKYEAQLEFKRTLVRDALTKIGKLAKIEVEPVIGMANPRNYRNKAQYPVQSFGGKVISGFFSRRSHDVVDIKECGIQDAESIVIKEIVRGFIKLKNISVYDEKTGKGLVRYIITRKGFTSGEVMVVLVLNGSKIPFEDVLIKELIKKVPAIKSIVINVNRVGTNTVLGAQNITIFGQEYITDKIGKYEFRISPKSFFQVNPAQTEVLYRKVVEFAALNSDSTVVDIYSGVGTISLFLSENAKQVYGIESVREAVDDAEKNAKLNGVGNASFIYGNAETAVKELHDKGIRPDAIVVDPPRKGCDESVLEAIAKISPDKIVYVSCNPATLARDLKYLTERGFEVRKVQPVDMFPHTEHVETVVLMSRVNKQV